MVGMQDENFFPVYFLNEIDKKKVDLYMLV